MTSTVFVNGVTLTDEDWFNDLNRLHYTIFNDAADLPGAFQRIASLTEDTSPDIAADFLATSDTSAATGKKILLSRLKPVLGTPVASTSGTSIDFTGIPSSAKFVYVHLKEVSTSGSNQLEVQIGSGSVTTSGYVSSGSSIVNAGATVVSNATAAFIGEGTGAAGNIRSGTIILALENSSANSWLASGTYKTGTTAMASIGGSVSLAGAIDRVRITTVGGTDTFDAGEINITYE
jgi:hypothetical protein